MAFVVNMPRLGLSEEENVLCEWYVAEGDRVETGDKLFSIETVRSSMDIHTEHGGIILKLMCEEFDVVPVMTAVCIVGESGEDISNIINQTKDTAFCVEPQLTLQSEQSEKNDYLYNLVQRPMEEKSIRRISPRARKLAEANGIDLSGVSPSGAEGRIVEEDILNTMKSAYQQSNSATKRQETKAFATIKQDGKTITTSKTRRIIAKNMVSSLRNTAQTTIHMRYNASNLQSYRAWLKSAPGFEKDITLNELISYTTVKTLLGFDYMNAHMPCAEEIILFEQIHLGFAVNTKKGLLVPTVKNAQNMDLPTFSFTLKALAEKARDGSILAEEMSDATFTISNMGTYGVTNFNPILNPPQVGILGVGTIDYAMKDTPEGMLFYPAGYISLTYDHRAIDGAPAAEFLRSLCNALESANMSALGG